MEEREIMRGSLRAIAVVGAYEGGYRVSDAGDAVSPYGRILTPQVGKGKKYYSFSIRMRIDERSRRLPVQHHQLMAYQKYGEDALGVGVHVRHLDGNHTNNSVANIAIGSASDNRNDIPEYVHIEIGRKAARANRRLSEDQVAALRSERAEGVTLRVLAAKYGLCSATISRIARRERYKESLGVLIDNANPLGTD